uniref:Uncharacterized protein n=1 Tax=viral metagenome TaxID=1070528 RepID=A0A6C0HDC8_9ZZZZ
MFKTIITILLLSSVLGLNPKDSEYMTVDEIYKNILSEQECEINSLGVVECGLKEFITSQKFNDILDNIDDMVNNISKFDEILNSKSESKFTINGVNIYDTLKNKEYFDELLTKILISGHVHFNINLEIH